MTPLARVGIIGDIHAEARSLMTALRHLRSQNVDAVLAVGDIVDGEGDVDECVGLLAAARAIVVAGNHERWFVAQTERSLPDWTALDAVNETTRDFLAALPATRTLLTTAGPLLLCHGLGTDDMKGVWPHDRDEDAREKTRLLAGHPPFVVNGHTHHRMARKIDGFTIVNAGTLRSQEAACCGVIDFAVGQVEFFDVVDERRVVAAERFEIGRGERA